MGKREVTYLEWNGKKIAVADKEGIPITRQPVPGIFGHEGDKQEVTVAFALDCNDDPRGGGPIQIFAEAHLTFRDRGALPMLACLHMDDPYQIRELSWRLMRVADELANAQQMIAEMGADAPRLLLQPAKEVK